MKKTAILIIVVFLAPPCFSQVKKQPEFQKKIEDIEKHIRDLQHQQEFIIHNEWKKIQNDSLTKNPKECFEKLNKEKTRCTDSIKAVQARINNLKQDNWVRDLRIYYQNGKIDQLYAHADLRSLSKHIKILGENHPKVMDDLEILLRCSELLHKEYNAKENEQCQAQLKEVQECATKESLQYFLSVQNDITAEVNEWIKDDKNHTLFGIMAFYYEIEDAYKISFDEQFPYLSQKVRNIVMEKMKQQPSSSGR